MAKKQTYSEDLLLEAVIKYSEVCENKIKATELAQWARGNVPGLEEVKDVDFYRTKQKKGKNGKIQKRNRLCKTRMDEYNKERSITAVVGKNVLLRANNVDDFFKLSSLEQRILVAETRETVGTLEKQSAYLRRNNTFLKKENAELKEENEELKHRVRNVEKIIEGMSSKLEHVLSNFDEKSRKTILNEMGIYDGKVDLLQNAKSIEEDTSVYESFSNLANKRAAIDKKDHEIEKSLKQLVFDALNK